MYIQCRGPCCWMWWWVSTLLRSRQYCPSNKHYLNSIFFIFPSFYLSFSEYNGIEVSAPKARVINSVISNRQWEICVEKDENTFWCFPGNSSATWKFPEDQAVDLGSSNDGYVRAPSNGYDCGMSVCGRPFVDERGKSLLASPLSDNECSSSSCQGGLGEETTNSTNCFDLGNEWTRSALGEHASVASFAAFTVALMTNGGPSDLVEDSLKAALDEVRHAKISFEIASKLLGKDITPGALPSSSHQFDQNLTKLAMAVAKEGCVDETLSALAAAAEVELIDHVLKHGAVDQGSKYFGVSSGTLVWIKNELHTIAMDESKHSALAWRTFYWVCTVDSEACSIVNQAVLDGNKLKSAFQHRFGSKNFAVETPELLERMAEAWTDICTKQIAAPSSAQDNEVTEECNDRSVESQSLLRILVHSISHGGGYKA